MEGKKRETKNRTKIRVNKLKNNKISDLNNCINKYLKYNWHKYTKRQTDRRDKNIYPYYTLFTRNSLQV